MSLANVYSPNPLQRDADRARAALVRDGKRADGRQPLEFRPFVARLGTTADASGSAHVELGACKVVASVYGPKSASRGKAVYSEQGRIVCDVRYAPFAQRERRSMAQDADERHLCVLLEQALAPAVLLERYPKSAIEVYVIVLEDGGSALAAAVTCAFAALMDAGIETRDVLTAAAALIGPDGALVDPTREEEAVQGAAHLTVACTRDGSITLLEHAGATSAEALADAVQLCTDGCATVADMVRTALSAQRTDALLRAVADAQGAGRLKAAGHSAAATDA